MDNEREDMVAPPDPQPTNLTDSEQRAVYREHCRGGKEAKLADYFNTTITNIRRAIDKGNSKKWMK
jgi:hypothetical protein